MERGMTISEYFREHYPEVMSWRGSFPSETTFDIGFINPELESSGCANDETQLSAENLDDLETLYADFCLENAFPADTVMYVDIVEEFDGLFS